MLGFVIHPIQKINTSKKYFYQFNNAVVLFKLRYSSILPPDKLEEINIFLRLWGKNKLVRVMTFCKLGFPFANTLAKKAEMLIKMLLL